MQAAGGIVTGNSRNRNKTGPTNIVKIVELFEIFEISKNSGEWKKVECRTLKLRKLGRTREELGNSGLSEPRKIY